MTAKEKRLVLSAQRTLELGIEKDKISLRKAFKDKMKLPEIPEIKFKQLQSPKLKPVDNPSFEFLPNLDQDQDKDRGESIANSEVISEAQDQGPV